MYIPATFAQADRDAQLALIQSHGFATVITGDEVSHLPLALDGDVLIGHVARANPHWRAFASAPTLAVFTGPHAYVSPTWYAGPDHVPTWNYAVVHVRGTARVVDDARALAILDRLVAQYEPTPWRVRDLPDDKVAALVKAIVAFELPLDAIEAKWKVGQNRTREDALAAADALAARGGIDAEVAALMKQAAR